MLKKWLISTLMFFVFISMMQIVSAAQIDFNLSNLTSEGIIRVAFDPYYAVFGNLTWGTIFGFIGVGLYANERSIGTIATYLILVGIFVGIVFPYQIVFVFGMILTFVLSVIFYIVFIDTRT